MTPLEFRDSVDHALRLAVPDIVSCVSVSEYILCVPCCTVCAIELATFLVFIIIYSVKIV